MHAILLPWLIGGGVVLATVHNRNIAITLAMNIARGNAARVLAMTICALTALISVVVIAGTLPVLEAARHQVFTALWGVSAFWGYASLVYAFGGIAVVSILDLLMLTRGISRTGEAASSQS
ncbi:TRAP transporter small permease subunit [Cereibacter sp. SYSU M97828]|nr:TRAP transporter small permease subunit [Cereibacter flavus]